MWPLGEAPTDSPVLVVFSDRVVSATPKAMEAGVRKGMARREAERLCPEATIRFRDPGEEMRRFEPVVTLLEELIPRVEVVEPGLVFIPIGGAVRYYGGEEETAEVVMGKLRRYSPIHLAIADGPFAAYWAARTAPPDSPRMVTDAFLASLDVATLLDGRADTEALVATLRWLGVTTLGRLGELPREAVASRFGPVGIEAHRLSRGEDRPVRPRRIPADLRVEARFEDPLTSLDQVGFAARELAARLMDGLRREGVAPHRVVIEAEMADGRVRSRVWRSIDPLTEGGIVDRIWWQLRAWLDLDPNSVSGVGSGGGSHGLVRLLLDPSDLGAGRQLSLLGEEAGTLAAERSLARAQGLVGPDGVLQADVQGGRLPGEQVLWYRWGEGVPPPERSPAAPWPGATPTPSPALVPPRPVRVEVEWDGGIPVRMRLGSRWEPVLSWSGPWRLTGRWWEGEESADRYQLVTSVGAFLCVVREGRTYLAGVYD